MGSCSTLATAGRRGQGPVQPRLVLPQGPWFNEHQPPQVRCPTDLPSMETTLRQVLAQNAWLGMATIAFKNLGQHYDALRGHFESSEGTRPVMLLRSSTVDFLHALGVCADIAGKQALAVDALTAAVTVSPGNEESRVELVHVLASSEGTDPVQLERHSGVLLASRDPCLRGRGALGVMVALGRQGKAVESRQALNTALKLSPQDQDLLAAMQRNPALTQPQPEEGFLPGVDMGGTCTTSVRPRNVVPAPP